MKAIACGVKSASILLFQRPRCAGFLNQISDCLDDLSKLKTYRSLDSSCRPAQRLSHAPQKQKTPLSQGFLLSKRKRSLR